MRSCTTDGIGGVICYMYGTALAMVDTSEWTSGQIETGNPHEDSTLTRVPVVQHTPNEPMTRPNLRDSSALENRLLDAVDRYTDICLQEIAAVKRNPTVKPCYPTAANGRKLIPIGEAVAVHGGPLFQPAMDVLFLQDITGDERFTGRGELTDEQLDIVCMHAQPLPSVSRSETTQTNSSSANDDAVSANSEQLDIVTSRGQPLPSVRWSTRTNNSIAVDEAVKENLVSANDEQLDNENSRGEPLPAVRWSTRTNSSAVDEAVKENLVSANNEQLDNVNSRGQPLPAVRRRTRMKNYIAVDEAVNEAVNVDNYNGDGSVVDTGSARSVSWDYLASQGVCLPSAKHGVLPTDFLMHMTVNFDLIAENMLKALGIWVPAGKSPSQYILEKCMSGGA